MPPLVVTAWISIHSLRMEGDNLSKLSCREVIISIHSLRMEGDFIYLFLILSKILFQSTPSAWRETLFDDSMLPIRNISIHSLRMEGDFSDSNSIFF